jgi:AcrR family transcriptional regulator
MALLWRTGQPVKARRTGLTVDGIVAAAVDVADAEGLLALSMRRVAEQLGVGTMSLYTHVPSKAELIDLMLDTVCAESTGPDKPTRGWRARLERVAQENWSLFHRHPWVLQIGRSRPVLGPNLIAKYERELRAIDGIGLTDVEMDAVLALVLGHVEGAARRSVESALAVQQTGVTDEQWWAARAPLLEKVFDPERFPIASRVGAAAGEAYGAASAPEHEFGFGLQRILDGIETFLARRHAGR